MAQCLSLLEAVALRAMSHGPTGQACVHAGRTGGGVGSYLVQSIHFDVGMWGKVLDGKPG